MVNTAYLVFLKSYVSFVWMQALDSCISPILGFNGDIPILAIPVLAWPSGDKSTSDPSARTGASALKTQAGMRKATANPTL
jgi:hypothetical protein